MRDVADREARRCERIGFLLQHVDRDIGLQLPRLHVLDRLLPPGAAPRRATSACVSSMPSPSAWRRSATSRSGYFSGKSFSPPCSVSKYSQITSEVVDHRPVREPQRRQPALRIFLHQLDVRLRAGDHGAHGLDAIGKPAFMRRNHHLAHIGRARRPVQQHSFIAFPLAREASHQSGRCAKSWHIAAHSTWPDAASSDVRQLAKRGEEMPIDKRVTSRRRARWRV